MNDRQHYQACFDLMRAVAAYRYESIHRHLEKFGKRELNCYGPKLMDGCWLIIDDYGGPADNSKVSATKTQVDELVNSGRLLPLGYYGFGTWVGRWQGIMPPRDR